MDAVADDGTGRRRTHDPRLPAVERLHGSGAHEGATLVERERVHKVNRYDRATRPHPSTPSTPPRSSPPQRTKTRRTTGILSSTEVLKRKVLPSRMAPSPPAAAISS